MNTCHKTEVLIAERQTTLYDMMTGLFGCLEEKIDVVHSVEETLSLLKNSFPTAIFMERTLFSETTYVDEQSFLHMLHSLFPKTRLVLMVKTIEPRTTIELFRQGVTDVFMMPYKKEVLRESLERLSLRRLYHSKSEECSQQENDYTITFADLHINPIERTLQKGQLRVQLSPNELSLLVCLIEHHGKAVPHEFLALEMSGGSCQVKSYQDLTKRYVHSLRKKLQHNLISSIYIQSIRGVGYRIRTL